MRVLYLVGKNPVPVNSGDALRNWALLQAARSVADRLDLVALPQTTGPDTITGLARTEELCDSVTLVGRPIGEQLAAPVNRLRTVLGRPYYHAVGRDAQIRAAIRERLASTRYDVVVLGQLYLASALSADVLARTVYDTHNVHHLRLRESLAGTRLLPAPVRQRMIKQVHDQEARLMAQVAVIVACSDLDAAGLSAMCPQARVEVIANGIDLPATTIHTGSAGRPLFLASLDATANIEGLAHLVDGVLPHLSSGVQIDVAGSNARPVVARILARAGDRVHYRGQVPDARATMADAAALLVPLLTGGGTRLKVLEAFAVGLPVVSTSKGVEGIPVTHGRHAFVVDTSAEFAAAVETLLTDPSVGHALAANARTLVDDGFAWTGLGARFANLLVEVGAERRGPVPVVPRVKR